MTQDLQIDPRQVAARRFRALAAQLARSDPSEFCSFVLRDEETGLRIRQAPMHKRWHELIDEHDRLVVWSHVEGGKCLAPETEVVLFDGRVIAAKDVRAGDLLMGPDSKPRCVLSTTEGRGPLFVIKPRRGRKYWVCNDVHVLTLVHTATDEIIDIPLDEYLRRSAWWKSNYKLFQPDEPFDFAPHEHPSVDPYFLGIWFGDGTKTTGSFGDLRGVAVSKPDAEILVACEDVARTWSLRVSIDAPNSPCPTYRIVADKPGTTNPLLDAMRELVGQEKSVPESVVRGSIAVRAAFLAGLLDTDGNKHNGVGIELTQKRRDIVEAAVFISRSLGLYASQPREKTVEGETYWRTRIGGKGMDRIPMRVARKIPRAREECARCATRFGFDVEPVEFGRYVGFTLDGDGRFLLGDFTVTHNTNQIAIGRALYELGKNPSLRIVIVSNTSDMAKKMVRQVGQYVEKSAELREVFPNLKPSKDPSLPWTAMSLTVERGRIGGKDPSVQACGVHGNIMGSRIDLLILDDVLDYENTRTPTPREDVWRWVRSSLFSRLTRYARVVVVGNAWHPDDLLHKLAAEPDFKAFKFPVVDARGNLTWPERWPQDRIDKQRRDLGPLEYARQLLCQARDDDSARFRREWIDACRARGRGKLMASSRVALYRALLEENGFDPATVVPGLSPEIVAALEAVGAAADPDKVVETQFDLLKSNDDYWFLRGIRFFSGVDLAVQKHDAADLSVVFTIAVFPDGTRRVCWIESGKWGSPEIVAKIKDTYRRFGSTCVVENVGAQDYIVQFVREQSDVPVLPFTTGRTKAHPEFGVESLAAEFAAAKWVIPCAANGDCSAEVDAWIKGLLFYDPMGHTDDYVMAGWFAREGARASGLGSGGGCADVRVFGSGAAKGAALPRLSAFGRRRRAKMSWEEEGS